MARELLPDDPWAIIEPLLPPVPPPGRNGGRPRLGDRPAPTGIPFVLEAGLPREDPPAEMGCGCGMSCRRRRAARLGRLDAAGKLDGSKAVVDPSRVRAGLGGSRPARTPPLGGRTAPSTTC